MSSDAVGETSVSSESPVPVQSAGMILRSAREAAGLHVAALAVSMKVPVKKLEALEADRLELLPDAVFVRALASSVCRALKIDAVPVLKLLPQTSVPKLDTQKGGINTPFHAAGDFKARTWPTFFSRPAVLWVACLLLGVLVVMFYPESHTPPTTTSTLVSPAKQPIEVEVTASAAREPVAVEATAAAANAVAASGAAVPVAALPTDRLAAAAPAAPIPTGLLGKVPPAVVPASTVSATAGTAGALVSVRAKGETWVEVTDAKGVVQLRKILAANEVVSASGALPLSVVIGRADMTQVEVRGQAFSLDAISKDNVARFEVK